jgi:hypothetical protein
MSDSTGFDRAEKDAMYRSCAGLTRKMARMRHDGLPVDKMFGASCTEFSAVPEELIADPRILRVSHTKAVGCTNFLNHCTVLGIRINPAQTVCDFELIDNDVGVRVGNIRVIFSPLALCDEPSVDAKYTQLLVYESCQPQDLEKMFVRMLTVPTPSTPKPVDRMAELLSEYTMKLDGRVGAK